MRDNSPVLLVEDDLVDAMTVSRSFQDLDITNKIEHCVNGVEALARLQEMTTKPSIILLDINMPKMNGIEFLERIKKAEEYLSIPVVVLTTSNDDRDKMESYNLGIAGYMLKPVDYQQFVQIMRNINVYWTLSELPN